MVTIHQNDQVFYHICPKKEHTKLGQTSIESGPKYRNPKQHI